MKRSWLFAVVILEALLVAGGVYWWVFVRNVPEIVEEPIFQPIEGAVKERVVMKVGDLSSEYVSSSQPISASVAEGRINIFLPNDTTSHGHSEDGTDFDVPMQESRAVAAKLYRFESPDLCRGEICPMGLFAIGDGQKDELENPVFITQAVSIRFTDTLTNGNPDLIVDYGAPVGVKRLKWNVDGLFPAYMDDTVTE